MTTSNDELINEGLQRVSEAARFLGVKGPNRSPAG
jgi:hypothetical protein